MTLPEAVLGGRVIPVARHLDATRAPIVVDALARGGINVIEITVEGEGGLDAIAAIAGDEVMVGAGTVVSVSQAHRAVEAGARFLVSPHYDPALSVWADDHGVPLIPGELSPTEIVTAWGHRPPAVKVFPAHVGGPGYLRSLLDPFPDLALVPTGGIDGANAAAYLEAGAVAVGVGGWLTSHEDMSVVTQRARLLVAEVV